MKQLRRWLFNFAAAVSLVLCFATGSIAIRGHWRFDVIGWANESFGLAFESGNAEMAIRFGQNYKGSFNLPTFENGWRYYSAHAKYREMARYEVPAAKYHQLAWLGFGYEPAHSDTTSKLPNVVWHVPSTLYFPLWSLAAITGVLPAMWGWQRRREDVRERHGCCARCGYDLRATPERCPECGTIPEPKEMVKT